MLITIKRAVEAGIRRFALEITRTFSLVENASSRCASRTILITILVVSVATALFPASALLAEDKKNDLPQGFEIYLKVPDTVVIKAIQEVIEDDTIEGTWIYDNNRTITGAVSETSSSYYGDYKGNGHVFFKVLHNALAPRHFKEANDVGTITVRYIVESVAPAKTRLQIDAAFVEDGNKKLHASDTTVETSEFTDIQAQIVEIQKDQQQTADLAQRRENMKESIAASKERTAEIQRLKDSETSVASLQQKVEELHHKLEVRVKSDPVELKSAPFMKAAKLAALSPHADLLVEIVTEYWYGVETVDGHRGWVRQDQVEALP